MVRDDQDDGLHVTESPGSPRGICLMWYPAVGDDKKECNKQVEAEGMIVLEGCDDDPDLTHLINSLLDLLATECTTEKTQREVDMLSEI